MTMKDDALQRVKSKLNRVVCGCAQEMSAEDPAIGTCDASMRVHDGGSILSDTEISLQREQFHRIVVRVRNILVSIPEGQGRIPYHPNPEKEKRTGGSQASESVHQRLAILETYNPLLIAPKVDHDRRMVPFSVSGYQVRYRSGNRMPWLPLD